MYVYFSFFLLLYNEHKYFQHKLQLEIKHVFTFIHSLFQCKPRVWGLIIYSLLLLFNYVPAHVGIYGNERADRLAKATARRAHTAAARSREQREEQALEALTDSIVAALTAN